MIRGFLWLLLRAPRGLWVTLRFLCCVLVTWHVWLAPRARGCGCTVRDCAVCGWTTSDHLCAWCAR
jgi:hypothetical protein